jgi:hypothetical protein
LEREREEKRERERWIEGFVAGRAPWTVHAPRTRTRPAPAGHARGVAAAADQAPGFRFAAAAAAGNLELISCRPGNPLQRSTRLVGQMGVAIGGHMIGQTTRMRYRLSAAGVASGITDP